jgi:hypothetical protein
MRQCICKQAVVLKLSKYKRTVAPKHDILDMCSYRLFYCFIMWNHVSKFGEMFFIHPFCLCDDVHVHSSMRFIIAIAQFQVTIPMNCQALIHCVNVLYIIG